MQLELLLIASRKYKRNALFDPGFGLAVGAGNWCFIDQMPSHTPSSSTCDFCCSWKSPLLGIMLTQAVKNSSSTRDKTLQVHPIRRADFLFFSHSFLGPT